MGEKYDCYDDAPRIRISDQILRRSNSPVGEGFPAPRYAEMLAGGEAAKDALREYGSRPGETIRAAAASAGEALRSAVDAEPAVKIAAGSEVASTFNQCFQNVGKQFAQANTTYEMVLDHGSMPEPDVAEIARGNMRGVKKTATEELGLVDELLGRVFSTVEDAAVNAAGAQAEAAVNRVGQLAYTNTSRLYNAMTRRGMLDVPEATDPAA